MLIPCQKHNENHNLSQSQMADLIEFYKAQWVSAASQSDHIPVDKANLYKVICPLEDAKSLAGSGLPPLDGTRRWSPVAHVHRMRDLRKEFRKDR